MMVYDGISEPSEQDTRGLFGNMDGFVVARI